MSPPGWMLAAALVVGCGQPAVGGDGGEPADAGQDGGLADAGKDAGADAGGDGGTDAGTTVDCTRLGQTRTADIGLLDRLRSEVAGAQGSAELAALTQAFFLAVAEGGGTPLSSSAGERVAFVARDAPQVRYAVGSSFNGWNPGGDVLQRVGQSGVWALEKTLGRDQAYEYKMVDGDAWYEDRRAQHLTWDGIDRQGPGEFNAVVYPEKRPAAQGRLVAWRSVRSELLNDARDVFVYLPAAYDHPSCPTLPSLYFHDGNESLTRSPFAAAADATYAAHPGEAALLVFVALPEQSVRMKQYTFGGDSQGDQYVDFLATELRPKVEAAFRTCPKEVDRGLAGASLGGLISAHGAFRRPQEWGYIGSQSGSFFWESDAMLTLVKDQPRKALRWYLDHGCPNDNCEVNRRLKQELLAKGYELRHVEEAGGLHQWPYWQARLPGLLRHFREGRQGCAP